MDTRLLDKAKEIMELEHFDEEERALAMSDDEFLEDLVSDPELYGKKYFRYLINCGSEL